MATTAVIAKKDRPKKGRHPFPAQPCDFFTVVSLSRCHTTPHANRAALHCTTISNFFI